MTKTPIIWNGTTVGFILDMKGEMFEVYGKWLPLDCDEFWSSIKSGKQVTVQIGTEEPILTGTVVLASFYKDTLSIRFHP
jgi:hypothetical protein